MTTSTQTTTNSVTLNKSSIKNIIANCVPALTSMIFRKQATEDMATMKPNDLNNYVASLHLHPHQCSVIALALTNAFVELELSTPYLATEVTAHCGYHLDKARALNKTLCELGGSGKAMVNKAIELDLMVKTTQDDVEFLALSPKWAEMVLQKEVALPAVGRMKDSERATDYVKGGKVQPSQLLKQSIIHLQDTTYHVHGDMLSILNGLQATTKLMPFDTKGRSFIMAELETYGYVIKGCNDMVQHPELTSEYDADNRGRLYHIACAGANPQASDLARSVYAHNTENFVSKLDDEGNETLEYKMFMDEVEDNAGNAKFATDASLRYMAKNPVQYLITVLTRMSNTGTTPADIEERNNVPKKPFTMVRLAMDYVDFQETGKCDSRLGFGLDAKCSGTQYFAITAGCNVMAEATGITTKKQSDTTDPYVRSAQMLREAHNHYAFANRSFIKTPYMAVQYGGGVNALVTSKDNIQNLVDAGIAKQDMGEVAEHCIEAINAALGDTINNFKDVVEDTVRSILKASGETHLVYKHTDGLVVDRPCAPRVDVCPAWSINTGGKRVYFGKSQANWKVKCAVPTADEFVRTFMVNFIQGLDALVARAVCKYARIAGLGSFTSIHDCFRTTLKDAPKLKAVITQAYKECFVDNDQHENLLSQLGRPNMVGYKNVVTEDILNHENSFYFCV